MRVKTAQTHVEELGAHVAGNNLSRLLQRLSQRITSPVNDVRIRYVEFACHLQPDGTLEGIESGLTHLLVQHLLRCCLVMQR